MADWERGAVLLNAYRVVPRLIMLVYFTFFIKAWFFIVEWFTRIDWNTLPVDPIVGATAAAAMAGFPAIILGILTKILMDLTRSYWGDSSSAGN